MIDFVKVMKAGGSPSQWIRFPKDNIDFKKRFRSSSALRRRRRRSALDGLYEIARNDSLKHGHRSVQRSMAFGLILTREVVRYVGWRAFQFQSRRNIRRRCSQLGQLHKDPLTASLITFLPCHIVEDFAFYALSYASEDSPLDSRKLKNGYAIRYAERQHHGLPTMLLQHGGFYGELAGHDGGAIESLASHYFMTWGSKFTPNSIPWRAPRLERFERKFLEAPRGKSVSTLVVLEKNGARDVDAALTISRGLAALGGQRAASTQVGIRLRGKPGRTTGSSSLVEHLQSQIKALPHVRITDPVPMYEAVKLSGLVILTDHPATAFLECARVQHPCIALVRGPEIYTRLMQEYYTYFMSVGVFHPTIEGMTEFLFQVNGSRSEWWEGIKGSVEYRSFRRLFCGLGG